LQKLSHLKNRLILEENFDPFTIYHSLFTSMVKHLAIFEGDAIEKILLGEKTIDGRFSQKRLPPFGVVSKGDLVYLKRSGGEVKGQFLVDRVIFFDHPTKEEIADIRTKYKSKLSLSDSFWFSHPQINYLTLMFIELPQNLITQPKFVKKDLRGWVVLK